MPKTLATNVSWQPLGEIAYLLQLAADHLWQAADTAGTDSPLHHVLTAARTVRSLAITSIGRRRRPKSRFWSTAAASVPQDQPPVPSSTVIETPFSAWIAP